MSHLLHFGEIVAMNAYLSPDKVGARDLTRSLTFRGWNDRSCKLANALVGLGLEKGDRIAVLAYNCLGNLCGGRQGGARRCADQFQADWRRGPVHRRELRS